MIEYYYEHTEARAYSPQVGRFFLFDTAMKLRETALMRCLNLRLPEPHCSTVAQFQDSPSSQDKSLRSNIQVGWLTFINRSPETSAADETAGHLSTTACFRNLSICPSKLASVMLQSTRIEFER